LSAFAATTLATTLPRRHLACAAGVVRRLA
jgi:hypothetical protein